VRVFAVNAGSSSLKLSLLEEGRTLEEHALGDPAQPETLQALEAALPPRDAVDAVAHRIVHGGPHLHATVVVDDAVRAQLDAAAELAPLHVPPALRILDLLRSRLAVPHVACFDTAFHASLPEPARTYAVPREWREVHGVRRYGFHGLSCAWSLHRAAAQLGRPPQELQIVVAHLGAGASVTAIRDGHSADTSMGFTPLEGLVMARRSGSVDPGALLWLLLSRGVAADAMSSALENESGLLGLAGSADMRDILQRAAAGDADAALARDVFVHRACASIAAMAASLHRVDALVFTGGIGEHADDVRERICTGLTVLGDMEVLVVQAREDLQMAREAEQVLRAARRP